MSGPAIHLYVFFTCIHYFSYSWTFFFNILLANYNEYIVKVNGYTSMFFLQSLQREKNFCDFLFASLDDITF